MTVVRSDQEEYELLASSLDPVYLMSHHIYVRSQSDEDDAPSSQVVLLQPWPKQEDLIRALELYHWVLGVKSRKVGFTTIGVGFGNWIQTFTANSRCHYISRRDAAAKDLLDRHKFSYKRLPPYMRLPIAKDNDHIFTIIGPAGDERTVEAYPATEDTAIEQTADYTLLDEFASVREPLASKLWGGIEPTIAPNGYCLMISRGKGPQGTFANLVRTSIAYGQRIVGHP